MLKLARRVALLALLALVCSACWLDVGGNSMHTGFNAIERAVQSDSWAGLHRVWTANVEPSDSTKLASSVAVVNGTLFIETDMGVLKAYDAAGNTSCSGTPTTCQPLWTAAAGGATTSPPSDPATDGATVFVGGADGKLYAFDARGDTNCGGTPTTCTPLWTASVGGTAFAPVVAGGRVFIGNSNGDLFAFDAAGSTGCGGAPRTCAPLWRTHTGAQYTSIGNLPAPAVTDSTLYYPSAHGLDAFDPAGVNGCSGTPNTCAPLWTADFGSGQPLGWPVVGGGVVYQSVFTSNGNVVALDAAGQRNCSGTPTVCTPLWTDNAQSTATVTPALGPDGVLYAGFSALDAFSTDGTTGCSGTPVVCQPLHTASLGGLTLAPSLAQDVVVVGVFTGGTAALMAFGQGALAPLGSFSLGSTFPGLVAIADGMVFVATNDGRLQAWAP